MEDNDFDDDFDSDFDGDFDEQVFEATRPQGKALNWRRVELMKERLQLMKQMNDFDDYLD